MRDKARNLNRDKRVKFLTYLYLLHFTQLRPIDMLLPAALAQSVAMFVFLPHNIGALATSSLMIAIIAMLPGLAKPLLKNAR